jgi:hypothetical protein
MRLDILYMLKTALRDLQEAQEVLTDLNGLIAAHTQDPNCDVEWEDLQFLVKEIESRLTRAETLLRGAAYGEALLKSI